MNLFILRHGDAARLTTVDQDRPLTARGRDELNRTLNDCRESLTGIDHLLLSPYVRAQQTAEIAEAYLSQPPTKEICDLLVPDGGPSRLMEYLQQRQQDDSQFANVLLVGHQPLLGTFVDKLCGFEVGRYRLGTSALAHVSAEVVAADMGQLHWLRQPSDYVGQ